LDVELKNRKWESKITTTTTPLSEMQRRMKPGDLPG